MTRLELSYKAYLLRNLTINFDDAIDKKVLTFDEYRSSAFEKFSSMCYNAPKIDIKREK